jgi:hypothetical protein
MYISRERNLFGIGVITDLERLALTVRAEKVLAAYS